MNKNLTFKEVAKCPLLIKGEGQTAELSDEIGDNSVERLIQTGLLEISGGKFYLTSYGRKLVDIFNRGR
jgi:hypothetical protein